MSTWDTQGEGQSVFQEDDDTPTITFGNSLNDDHSHDHYGGESTA